MKKLVGAILIISCAVYAMNDNKQEADSSSEDEGIEFRVDRDAIAELKKQGFDSFIDTKKQQHRTLTRITSLPFGLGRAASTLLEGIGVVSDTDHAKCFLGRIFEKEPDFRATAASLEDNEDNITYLQEVFDQFDSKHVTKEELVQAMRKAKHKHVPEPSKMGEKTTNNEYVIPNTHFCQWAACNFLVFHWHEQQEKERRTPRKLKRKSSGAHKKS